MLRARLRILILHNPISGRGRAEAAARQLCGTLEAEGHDARNGETQIGAPEEWLLPSLEGADILVIVGGDGAVRAASASAAATRTPIYHFPFGTENLFSREFGMDREPETLLRAIDGGQVRDIDLGRANGVPFLLMASIGFDAEVVHDLSTRRTGAISHRTYAMPIVRQAFGWRPPRLHVQLDGRTVADEPGMLVVGNCRQYGWRLDPAVDADIADGRLDVVFFPTRGPLRLLRWVIATRCRRHVRHPKLVYERGERVEVTGPTPFRYQLDGDRPDEDAVERLVVEIEPRVLPVLVP
jgi:diacylglycerol kinase family enzyme